MDWLENLKKLKNKTDETYKSISEKTNISQSTIEKVFSGRTKDPKLNMIKDIVHCLGYTLDDLLSEDSNYAQKGYSNDEVEIINNYRNLNDFGQNQTKEYINFLLSSDKYKKENKPPVKEQKKMPTIFYYDVPASAGTGEYLDYSTASLVSVDDDIPSNASYILKVAGDSMEPRFSDGDYIYVNKNNSLNFGDIGIFYYDNNVYIKKYGPEGLISLNPKYSDIKGHEDIRCLGKVIGKVNGEIYF